MPEPPEYLPIDQAPSRVRREYYRKKRREDALAVLVFALLAALAGWGAYSALRG